MTHQNRPCHHATGDCRWVAECRIVAAVPAFGPGVAFAGDVVRLLQPLPYGGRLSIHLPPPAGTALDGMFSLSGLETARRWPTRANGHMPPRNPTSDGVR